jgi:hypothetical protein
MPRSDEAILVLHGLDVDARGVRADVFALKLRTLIAGLRDADRFANGKVGYIYMIAALATGSASVTIRQKQRFNKRPVYSGIATYEEAASAIYNGDRTVAHYPERLVRRVGQLSSGALQTFSHAELVFADDNIIRIDDFLERQSQAAHQALIPGPEAPSDQYYRGRAIGSFDGELKEIDNRGLILRGKLILSAGAVEIDCVMNKERVPDAREAFDKRVIIEGTAHYDGAQQLPTRIDVATIRVVGDRSDLLRWRGAFIITTPEAETEDEWC